MSKENNQSFSDTTLLWFAAISVIGYIAYKVWIKFLLLMQSFWWKLGISFFCANLTVLAAFKVKRILQQKKLEFEQNKSILGIEESAVFSGRTKEGEDVYIKTRQRSMHTQIIGTTNAGKTESIIIPWAIQDIKQGRGLILIDGKADRSLLDKLWTYSIRMGREADFKLFSLSSIAESEQFNPLIGGTSEEITERVFNAFEFENPHYRSIQFDVFSQIMRIFEESKTIPTFSKIHQCLVEPYTLFSLKAKIESEKLKNWISYFIDLPPRDREERSSGLIAALSHFSSGRSEVLFNTDTPSINLDEALAKGQIIYFQLPVLLSPFLGKACGKLILQCLQSAIANRHRTHEKEKLKFYSVFLDDFSEYLYPGFVSILNKSRSANIGIVFAHQALGDIKTLGDPIANAILTNSNLKIFMRGNDPDSAEYFSKVIGTKTGKKQTVRTTRAFLSQHDTGEASVRDVEEFIVHPNYFKREMGVGEAFMVIPHERGAKTVRVKFSMYADLPAKPLRQIVKTKVDRIDVVKDLDKKSTHKNHFEESNQSQNLEG